VEAVIDQKPARRWQSDRLHVGVVMLLIAGVALGIWLALPEFQAELRNDDIDQRIGAVLLLIVFVLGGLSLVGPPLLLLTARRRPWGAGRFLWFAHGTAAWLLWPPIVYVRAGGTGHRSASAACFFYGTPLMAVYVTLALLAGGHFRRSRRRRMSRSWQETFGLLLGLLWACTGLYLISTFYRSDVFGK
jgi:hypothetical protein